MTKEKHGIETDFSNNNNNNNNNNKNNNKTNASCLSTYNIDCRSLEIQFPSTLFVTIFAWFLLQSACLKTGQGNRNSSLGLNKGWPRPLSRGHCLK